MHLHALYAALFIKWNSPASCQYQWESDTHLILSVRNLGQIYKKSMQMSLWFSYVSFKCIFKEIWEY